MQNLKIRVNSEAESREVQDILFSVGKTHDDGSTDHYQFCFGKYPHFINCEAKYISASRTGYLSYDKITLPELRAMVNPKMKEYLIPDRNYEYILTDAREGLEPHARDWIEIPEGAEAFGYTGIVHTFYKNDFRSFFNENTNGQWDERSETWIGGKDPVILWQREQDEPFLTSECTLNEHCGGTVKSYIDKFHVSSIDVNTSKEIHGTVKAKPDFNFGAADASGGTKPRENNHYFIDVSDVNEVDFYEIAKRYNVTDPAVQHILKKCLAIGNRGHKDLETDLKDILKTAKRALQINGFGG